MTTQILAQALTGLGGLLLIVEVYIIIGAVNCNRDPRQHPKKWKSLLVVVCIMTPIVVYCFVRAISIAGS